MVVLINGLHFNDKNRFMNIIPFQLYFLLFLSVSIRAQEAETGDCYAKCRVGNTYEKDEMSLFLYIAPSKAAIDLDTLY